MYCKNCGEKLEGDFCSNCGLNNNPNTNNSVDNGGFVWGLLGFMVPIVGLILFIIWKDERPKSAKASGTGALISFILSMICAIIMFLLMFILFNDL